MSEPEWAARTAQLNMSDVIECAEERMRLDVAAAEHRYWVARQAYEDAFTALWLAAEDVWRAAVSTQAAELAARGVASASCEWHDESQGHV